MHTGLTGPICSHCQKPVKLLRQQKVYYRAWEIFTCEATFQDDEWVLGCSERGGEGQGGATEATYKWYRLCCMEEVTPDEWLDWNLCSLEDL